MSTGQSCQRSGLYQAQCIHRTQIALSQGETFPPCGPGLHAVDWTLVQPTS